MRAILDTNILISFLLTRSGQQSTITQIIQAAVDTIYTLILPEEVVAELERKLSTNAYLRSRIMDADVNQLVALLRASGESLPPLAGSAPSLVRDPKDDYLLAATAIADADVLVTGDRDLLDIRELLKRPAIVSAAEFLEAITSMESTHP